MASVASPALRVTVRQASSVSSTSDRRVCLSTVNVSSSAMIFRRPACTTSSAKRLNRTEIWSDWRKCGSKKLRHVVALHSLRRRGNGMRQSRIVSEMAGQYEENFSDVDKHLLDQFTFKAVRCVLGQLQETNPPVYTFLYKPAPGQALMDYLTFKAMETVMKQLQEMNPGSYMWFYKFCVENRPQDGKYFIQTLVKERQELAERVMVTRLHLFNKWSKNYNHANVHKAIEDQNLELLRERLFQTVKFSAEGEDPKRPTPLE